MRTPAHNDAALDISAVRALVVDLEQPNPAIYWTDFLVSAGLGWTATLVGATLAGAPALLCMLVAGFAFFRATSFIHELTHVRHDTLPGFFLAWNVLVGVPLFMPSFLYVGVHLDHHRPSTYGTAQDPDYLLFPAMSRGERVGFLLGGLLVPVGLVLRFLIITPLSFIYPRLRARTLRQWSTLGINQRYQRKVLFGRPRRVALSQELGCFAWGMALIMLLASGLLPLYPVGYALAALGIAAVANQVRNLAAHRYGSANTPTDLRGQLLDSVTAAGLPWITELWAPVGLRLHALHHLLPWLPYHALPAAHRRLTASVASGDLYRQTFTPGLAAAAQTLWGSGSIRESRVPTQSDASQSPA